MGDAFPTTPNHGHTSGIPYQSHIAIATPNTCKSGRSLVPERSPVPATPHVGLPVPATLRAVSPAKANGGSPVSPFHGWPAAAASRQTPRHLSFSPGVPYSSPMPTPTPVATPTTSTRPKRSTAGIPPAKVQRPGLLGGWLRFHQTCVQRATL